MTLLSLANALLLRRAPLQTAEAGHPALAVRAAQPGWAGRLGLRAADCVAPAALLLWAHSLGSVHSSAMTAYGLLAVLPVTFFVAVGLLVVSIAVALRDGRSSPLRLGLHVIALVLVLHGTVPIVLSAPNYPWTYKHVGVTDYINLHGSLNSSIDIYQSWPGFFAAAAWFTKLAGVGSPLSYAAWAPVYFNLLTCVMLSFVFRAVAVARTTRWLAIFVFVAGNWVGQDYFSPQALAFVLSLAVLGMVLTWLQVDRPSPGVTAVCRFARRVARAAPRPAPDDGGSSSRRPAAAAGAAGWPRWLTAARLVALFAVFAAVVVSHQLSPYMTIIAVTGLVLAGKVRPRWVALVLTAEALAYLVPNLSFLARTQDLFGSLLQPFGNVGLNHIARSTPETGHRIVSLAAPALVLGLWALAAVGVVRRVRAQAPTLLLAVLAGSPVLLAVVQNYGGEAVLRIYLFSLPWTALLAASALAPGPRKSPHSATVKVGVALAGIVVLFMSAFYGSEELYRVEPGAQRASAYFYAHAQAGSVLILGAAQFPLLEAANYDRFVTPAPTPDLLSDKALLHHRLGKADLGTVSDFSANYTKGRQVYLALTTDEQSYAQVLGLTPAGSLPSLAGALAGDPRWRAFYHNRSAIIYQYLGRVGLHQATAQHRPGRPATATPAGRGARAAVPAGNLRRGVIGELASGVGRLPEAVRKPPAQSGSSGSPRLAAPEGRLLPFSPLTSSLLSAPAGG